MPHWVSAEKIVLDYAVGEARLLQYSARGNLPCRRSEDGSMSFDLEHVANLFRLRSAISAPSLSTDKLGVLGKMQLGQSPTVEAHLPMRRRAKVTRAERNLDDGVERRSMVRSEVRYIGMDRRSA